MPDLIKRGIVMKIKTLKSFGLALLLGSIFCSPASAGYSVSGTADTLLSNESLGSVAEALDIGTISVKAKPTYNKASDPAHHTKPEFSEPPRPQHGYFAVPLLVIGVAGIFLYFCRLE
jgi:hypothetical protein